MFIRTCMAMAFGWMLLFVGGYHEWTYDVCMICSCVCLFTLVLSSYLFLMYMTPSSEMAVLCLFLHVHPWNRS